MYSGKLVKLRGLELSDVDTIMGYFNDFEMRQYLAFAWPVSSGQEEDWVRSTWERRKNQTGFVFGIEALDTGELIGTCNLDINDWIVGSSSLGIALGRRYTDKGCGTEAMQLLLWFGFHVMNLNRVELEVLESNTRAIHVYEKLGFQLIGRRRQRRYRAGRHEDGILMDLLRKEWTVYEPVEAKTG